MGRAGTERQLAIHGGTPVRTQPLPWELPGAHWMGKEELELVSRVVAAQSPFRYYGPDPQHMVDKLEAAYRERLGRQYALGVGSGTAGLHIALGALGVGPGDEVLLPGYLWVSCIGAVVRLGAIPRLVDIDETFSMDVDDLRRKLSDRTKALLVVHMSGAPGDVEEIMKVARGANVPVVEDAAQANGATFRGRPIGSVGDLAVFSFQLNKNISSGDGGMVVCDDEDLYKRCFALHDLGYARDESGRLDTTDERYQFWGVGSRMSELAGAMVLAQLGKLDRITDAMRTAKWKIRSALEGTPGLGFRRIVDPRGDTGPFLITIYESPEVCRRFTEALRAEGIRGPEGSLACLTMEEWGLHWYFNNLSLVRRRGVTGHGWPWNLPDNAFARDYEYARGALPKADELASRSGLLTIASCLRDQDVEDIIQAFRKVASVVLPAGG